jgi:OOP family OmpA-OmpF porin
VPDHLDLCPNTPLGVQVDERGCWVVAYANFFDFGQAAVKSQYLPHLANAAEVIKNHPGLKVEIQGHTDAVGSDEYNLKLGLKRAEAVREALAANGVAADRLSVSSRGERQPIADNQKAKGRSLNRRVEIHVREPGAGSNVGAYSPDLIYPPPPPPALPSPPAGRKNVPVVR